MRICFVIHYAHGSVQQGHTLEDWRAMPDEDVLVVTEFFDRSYGHPPKYCGKRYAYNDYFWMHEDGTIGEGNASQIPNNVYIKRGQYVDSETWDRVYNLACVDPTYGTLS